MFEVVSVASTSREDEGLTQKCQGVVVESGVNRLTGAEYRRIVADFWARESWSQVFFSTVKWAFLASWTQMTDGHQPM